MGNRPIDTLLLEGDTVSIEGYDGEYMLLGMDYKLTVTYNFPYWIALCSIVNNGDCTIVTANEKCIELLRREKSY